MDAQDIPENRKFIQKAKDFVSGYKLHVGEAAAMSKQVYQKSLDLANCVNLLARSFDEMGKMNKQAKIPTQHKLFNKLGKIFASQSLALQNTGELIKIYCA